MGWGGRGCRCRSTRGSEGLSRGRSGCARRSHGSAGGGRGDIYGEIRAVRGH